MLMRFKSAVLTAFLELELYYYIPTVPRYSLSLSVCFSQML